MRGFLIVLALVAFGAAAFGAGMAYRGGPPTSARGLAQGFAPATETAAPTAAPAQAPPAPTTAPTTRLTVRWPIGDAYVVLACTNLPDGPAELIPGRPPLTYACEGRGGLLGEPVGGTIMYEVRMDPGSPCNPDPVEEIECGDAVGCAAEADRAEVEDGRIHLTAR